MRPCLSLLLLIVVSGCTHLKNDPVSHLKDHAEIAGFTYREIVVPPFNLASFYKNNDHLDVSAIHIYIEGDGHAWKNRFTPSLNPTPKNPIASKLALNDPSHRIIYLARPCQFVTLKTQSLCSAELWTSHRYSKQVIEVMNDAIDQALTSFNQNSSPKIILFGYSGGGSIATLISAYRTDVVGLVTIAANLDHQAWTNFHGDSSLTGSENAIDIAKKIVDIPQVHLIGDKDNVVPPIISESFIKQQSANNLSKLHIIRGYTHNCCWAENWPKHLKQISSDLTNSDQALPSDAITH